MCVLKGGARHARRVRAVLSGRDEALDALAQEGPLGEGQLQCQDNRKAVVNPLQPRLVGGHQIVDSIHVGAHDAEHVDGCRPGGGRAANRITVQVQMLVGSGSAEVQVRPPCHSRRVAHVVARVVACVVAVRVDDHPAAGLGCAVVGHDVCV